MTLPLIALLPFAGALLAGMAGRHGRSLPMAAALACTLAGLALVLGLAPRAMAGAVEWHHPWIPALGLDLSLRLDGLGLLFAVLILGIGALILVWTRFYLDAADPMGRFICQMMLFQGAMLGIVLSGNLLLLLVFWEMTSLASFLLIGFWSARAEARAGARMALAVTGGGGLALIAGALILGNLAGTFEIAGILARAGQIRQSPLFLPAMALVLAGAFAKSAQVPLHFWLPRAMAAPTPVSAYLHSATMVKAGLFLMARLWPLFAPAPEWVAVVTTIGLATMLVGAVSALFQRDLKALLACSTVSQLGLIAMLLGIGTPAAAAAAAFHILNHATFKAALFMAGGIVEHATHSRDMALLRGLGRAMPVTFALTGLAALSMAGVPPLNGFLSKEMMLTQVMALPPPTLTALVALSAALSAAYSFRLVGAIFLGPAPAALHPHDPGPGLWLPPAVLAAAVVLIGLMPMTLAGPLVDAAAGAMTGVPVHLHLALWHGPVPALWLSVMALGAGLALWGLWPRLAKGWAAASPPDAFVLASRGLDLLARGCRAISGAIHDGRLSLALFAAVAAVGAASAWAFATAPHAPGGRAMLPVPPAVLIGWTCLMIAAGMVALRHRDRLPALILTGVVGLMVSAAFALFSAPDLALTQITVEVVTVILMLMTLSVLPRTSPPESRPSRRLRDAGIAGAAGVGIGALAYALMRRDFAFPPISGFHLAQSLPGAGGTNAVNTIIVDFRGYDTYGEITVLGIAALVILALVETLRGHRPAMQALARLPLPAPAGDANPLMLVTASRVLLPLAMTVGIYIYLRGHNQPGGGFVAGLIFAIGFVAHFVASGLDWAEARVRMGGQAMIAVGLLIAGATGIGPLLGGKPFLTSGYDHFHWPLAGEVELATAALFDLGVFFAVLGGVMLTLAAIARLTRGAGTGA
ncbi:MAG: proton-conducting transporter membrane subunit [Paracoccaceae bacterium]